MENLKDTYLAIFESIDFEKIKDHPNILIAARFWEDDRYAAAKTCYRFMRAIDDLIDNHKASQKVISVEERDKFVKDVETWVSMIFDGSGDSPEQKELTETIKKFCIPSWPLEAFARSMVYDIFNDGFPTLDSFLEYAGGASVAPAAIFVHLAGLRKTNGHFTEPLFDVREAALSCAVFSYLVHIIRDFQKDQLNNLNYFADDHITGYGMTREMLYRMAKGAPIEKGFRKMIRDYYNLADEYRIKTFNCINNIWPYLEPRYQLSLEIIFNLYLMVFERIDPENGDFDSVRLNPTAEESRICVYNTIINSRTLS